MQSNQAGPVSPFKSCCMLFVKLAANVCLNSKDSPDWTLKPRGNHVIKPDQNFAVTTVSKVRSAQHIPDIYTCSYKRTFNVIFGR